MGYRDYPSSVPTDPTERAKYLRKVGLDHLLNVWQWFEVYHLKPYIPPYFSLEKEEYAKKEDDEGGEGGKTGDGFVTIEIEKCFRIFDFGDYLATSSGEEIGPLANKQLFTTVDKMLNLLQKRGATDIAFGKRCIQPVKLYAWQQAVLREINVHDFTPSAEDVSRLERTYGQLEHALKEIIAPE